MKNLICLKTLVRKPSRCHLWGASENRHQLRAQQKILPPLSWFSREVSEVNTHFDVATVHFILWGMVEWFRLCKTISWSIFSKMFFPISYIFSLYLYSFSAYKLFFAWFGRAIFLLQYLPLPPPTHPPLHAMKWSVPYGISYFLWIPPPFLATGAYLLVTFTNSF